MIEYEVVLASGAVVTASATSNPDLWRSLKGGGSNFGIVTRFVIRTFPCRDIWAGWAFYPGFQSSKIRWAFHDFVARADPRIENGEYDHYASGPLTCFCFKQRPGIEIIAVYLAYTKIPEPTGLWPACWRDTKFKTLWRLWSNCKQRSLTSACDVLAFGDVAGKAQTIAGIIVKNDKATLDAAYAIHKEASSEIRRLPGNGVMWVMTNQPILPDWIHKGDPNCLGLQDNFNEPHVLVSFSPTWTDDRHTEFIERLVKRCMERIERLAREKKTLHRWQYVNYCGPWQKPLEGYGEESVKSLRSVSKCYDPEGLFQRGCSGKFKLGSEDVSESKGLRDIIGSKQSAQD